LFGISGFWSIKKGLGGFSVSGKISVLGSFGGSCLSSQILPARIGPTSLFGS